MQVFVKFATADVDMISEVQVDHEHRLTSHTVFDILYYPVPLIFFPAASLATAK